MKNKVSPQVEEQALKVARGTQKPGQTKEQTKLIAQGVEKGIAEYKKQHSKKLRELDKQRKRQSKQQAVQSTETSEVQHGERQNYILPWGLLGLSWLGFVTYLVLQS